MTYARPDGLATFASPPVKAVEIGMAFQPLDFRVTQVNKFIAELSDDLPDVSEDAPSEARIVRLEESTPEIRFELLDRPPLPRITASSEDGSRQLVLQSDSVAFRWIRAEGAAYPSYAALREDFTEMFSRFEELTEDLEGSSIHLAQVHISYTNECLVEADSEADALSRVLRVASNSPESMGGFEPDLVALRLRKYYRDDPLVYAALVVNGASRQMEERRYRVSLRLLFAGNPFLWDGTTEALQTDDLFRFWDFGHDEIVDTFTKITRPAFQEEWGLQR